MKNIKKKYLIILTLLVMSLLSVGIVSYANNSTDVKQMMLNEAKGITANQDVLKNKTQIGEIDGLPLYAEELELYKIKKEAQNSANPYKDALESLKIIKHDEKLAEKYNIVITDEEVAEYNKDQRKLSEGADAETKQIVQEYINALGLTEDQYWTEYKMIENRGYLLKNTVQHYLEENKIQDIDKSEIEYKITNEKYQELIEQ